MILLQKKAGCLIDQKTQISSIMHGCENLLAQKWIGGIRKSWSLIKNSKPQESQKKLTSECESDK